MANRSGIGFQGFDDLDAVLAGLGSKMGPQVVNKIFTKAAKPLVKRAKELSSNADVTGETTKSIGIINNRKNGGITVGPRRGGGYKGQKAHLLEYGTAPHIIRAKAADGLLHFAGTFTQEVHHPGIAPQPFMRPAADSTLPTVIDGAKAGFREIIETEFKSVFK
ncbi:MAG: HK97 gp10 family phage protein [Janthinobacterium lividum]